MPAMSTGTVDTRSTEARSAETGADALAALVWPDLTRCSPALHVWVTHPDHATTMIGVSGELDAATAPEFDEMLTRECTPSLSTLVLDLSQLDFLSSAGLSLLVEARQRIGGRLRLVTGAHCVDRALEATGLRADFACYPTAPAALANRAGEAH